MHVLHRLHASLELIHHASLSVASSVRVGPGPLPRWCEQFYSFSHHLLTNLLHSAVARPSALPRPCCRAVAARAGAHMPTRFAELGVDCLQHLATIVSNWPEGLENDPIGLLVAQISMLSRESRASAQLALATLSSLRFPRQSRSVKFILIKTINDIH